MRAFRLLALAAAMAIPAAAANAQVGVYVGPPAVRFDHRVYVQPYPYTFAPRYDWRRDYRFDRRDHWRFEHRRDRW